MGSDYYVWERVAAHEGLQEELNRAIADIERQAAYIAKLEETIYQIREVARKAFE